MSPPLAWYFRSLPALKALSPAPVMIPTHSSGSFWNSSKASESSRFAGGWSEFITSGRLIVITNRWPSRSVLQNWGIGIPPRPCMLRETPRGPPPSV